MLKFYDPITNTQLELSDAEIFYLVRVYKHPEQPAKSTFRIQGLSASPDKLASDPITHTKEYWPISAHKMLTYLRQEKIKSLLFMDDQLVTRPLSLHEVRNCFHFNPNGVRPERFSEEVSRNLNHFWASNLPQTSAAGQFAVGYATSAQIEELVLLSRNFFSTEDIQGYLGYVIQRVITFLKKTNVLDLVVNNYFTQDNLLTLAFDHEDISELLTPDSETAMREQTITGDDLQRMSRRDMRLLLIHPSCLHALREKITSIDALKKLSHAELSAAIAQNHFPSPILSLPTV